MKKLRLFFGIGLFVFLFISCETEPILEPENQVANMSSKTTNSKLTGVDEWGFNYEAHHFNSYLINAILGDPAFQGMPHYKTAIYKGQGITFWNDLIYQYDYIPYFMPVELLDCKLIMHWNEGLLSKEGVYPNTWVDSNGWITFHFKMNKDGEKWSFFRKLVSRRSTDYVVDGIWYNKDGVEIGVESYDWPDLIITQVVTTGNVPYFFSEAYNSPYGPGFGKYKLNGN